MAISSISGSGSSIVQISTESNIEKQLAQLLSQKSDIQSQINSTENNKKLSTTEKDQDVKSLKAELEKIEMEIVALQSQLNNAAKNSEKTEIKKDTKKDTLTAYMTGKGIDVDENV